MADWPTDREHLRANPHKNQTKSNFFGKVWIQTACVFFPRKHFVSISRLSWASPNWVENRPFSFDSHVATIERRKSIIQPTYRKTFPCPKPTISRIHTVPLSTKVYKWEPDKMLGGNLRWISIPSKGSRNTPRRFILQKPEISAGADEPSWLTQLRLGQTLPYLFTLWNEEVNNSSFS